jgi:hypothetical protein
MVSANQGDVAPPVIIGVDEVVTRPGSEALGGISPSDGDAGQPVTVEEPAESNCLRQSKYGESTLCSPVRLGDGFVFRGALMLESLLILSQLGRGLLFGDLNGR